MQEILRPHIHSEIGMNIDKPLHIDTVRLTDVHDSYFTVTTEKNGNIHHLPFHNVSRIIEHEGGVQVGGLFQQKRSYPLIVKIRQIVDHIVT